MTQNGTASGERRHGTVYIALSAALILFSGSFIAIPLGIAALVFAVRLRRALLAEDADSARVCRRSCIILLAVGLAAAVVSGTVGLTALLCKYGKIRL